MVWGQLNFTINRSGLYDRQTIRWEENPVVGRVGCIRVPRTVSSAERCHPPCTGPEGITRYVVGQCPNPYLYTEFVLVSLRRNYKLYTCVLDSSRKNERLVFSFLFGTVTTVSKKSSQKTLI